MHVFHTRLALRLPLRALLACVLLLAFSSIPAGAAQRAAAIVIAERGDVRFARSGSGIFQRLGSQVELGVGDVVQTGPQGEAELLFSDGARIKMNVNSRLRISIGSRNSVQKNLFQALLGVIWAHLRPGQAIETPTANTVVRGTEVVLAVEGDGTTTLTVVEGEASFFNALGTVEVAASQQSIARPHQAPTPPVAVDVSGLIAWTADVAGLPLEFETMPETVLPQDDAVEADTLETAAQRTPGDPAAWLRLGQARRRQGDLPRALAAFAQAEQLSPNNAEARVGMALTFLSQGRVADARLALFPVQDQAAPLAVLGLADLHEGKGREAQGHLQAALARGPNLAPARALLALAYLTQNDVPDAGKTAREAVRLEPNSAQTEGTLAMTLFFAGQGKAAQIAARRAVRLNPRSPLALLAEGRTLLAGGQVEEARTAYEKAGALAPHLWLVHQELGVVYLRLDMPKKATEEDRIALNLNPSSADAHTNLGLALQQQGLYGEAEAEHRRAIALDPGNATAHGNLAALLIDRGRLEAARQELETGVRSAPERGILYARLAEISLYRQDLFAAQEFARRAVSLLPDSAVAHYALGRVCLEQDRTVQAEQEFRQATTLDRQFAEARYALGLTEEKTEAGLLNSFNTLLGSVLVGSPGSTLSLENLLTPGAEQRIQAALLDPTVVRVASRSYGDTQLDAQIGEQGTRDLAGSYLTDTPDRRGIRGITGEEQATNGVRANADSKRDNASFVFGQKAADSPSGVFVTGDYQDSSQGIDNGVASDPFAATQRFHSHFSHLLAGVNIASGERSRVRGLIQVSKALFGENDLTSTDNHNHFDIRSLNGELRWDDNFTETSLFSAGISLGSRHRQSNAVLANPDPTQPPIQIFASAKVQPYQFYVRDEVQVAPRLTLTGEMQVLRLDTFASTSFIGLAGVPPTQESRQKTFSLPNVIAAYQPDARSGFRLRVRRIAATLSDFQLLTPTDVFLFSYAGLPQPLDVLSFADGSSVEIEYDHTFSNASFLRLGAFQQDLRQASVLDSGSYDKARIRGARAGYEGLLSRDLSFLLSGDFNGAYDSEMNLRIAQVPDFDGLASLQYLNRAGYYAQAAYYYQGSRVAADGDRSHLGGFGVLNLRAGKRIGLRSNIFVELNNVFNKQYDILSVLQPSRQLAVGVSQRF